MSNSPGYSAEEDQALIRYREANLSYDEIVEAMARDGFRYRSRGSVSARISRLGLSNATVRSQGTPHRNMPADESRAKRCQWPLWENKVDGRFCGARTVTGRPYCGDHAARAYVRSKEDHRKSWEVAAE